MGYGEPFDTLRAVSNVEPLSRAVQGSWNRSSPPRLARTLVQA